MYHAQETFWSIDKHGNWTLKWQLRRGGAILFEHPDGATSWQEPELQSLAATVSRQWYATNA